MLFVGVVKEDIYSFHYTSKLLQSNSAYISVMFLSQSLHAMESHVMIKFLPTTLNQLFRVLTSANQEDVAVNVTRQVLAIAQN